MATSSSSRDVTNPVTARVLELLKAHGTHATSFQILEPGYSYWFDRQCPDGAVVAYIEHGNYRVAAGMPIAPLASQADVAVRFVGDTMQAGKKTLFFSADERFLLQLQQHEDCPRHASVPIGAQPEWNPQDYNTEGTATRTLRSQLHRAQNKGVTVRRVAPQELERPGFRAIVTSVMEQWLASRRMSAMRFLVDLQPFLHGTERRYYIAEQGSRAVGFLAAIPVYSRQGWFFEDLIRVPDAPNGTVECLVDFAMRDAAENGDKYVTLGLAPLAETANTPTTDITPGAQQLQAMFRWCYDKLNPLYQFQGVHRFKARFRPHHWETQYLVQCPPPLGLSSIHAVLSAFAGGGLIRFGIDTVLQWVARIRSKTWALTFLALGILLIPWTILLALADGNYWFGDESIQGAWVAFDSVMVIALIGLSFLCRSNHSAAQPMSVFLAGATLTDFVLTTVQALNLNHAVTGYTGLFLIAGMAGPLIATLLLTGFASTRRRRVPPFA